MPKSKYKRQYAEELVEYFKRFLEMRDDPKENNAAERRGLLTVEMDEGDVKVLKPPCSGYPSLIKFAIRIGVTPQTLNNWRDKHVEFMEAMEFADMIQDEVLNERALSGSVDGRVAMKIRELKINARKTEIEEIGGSQSKLTVNLNNDFTAAEEITVNTWEGEIVEDTAY